MANCRFLTSICTLGLVFITGPAVAQNDPVDWQPVDQTVADLDLRATSSRRVEPGIGVYGQSGGLYQRTDPLSGWPAEGTALSQTYQLRQPGFTAYLDRPDYLVTDRQGEVRLNAAPSTDGTYVDLIPPNTVFDLVYRPHTPRPLETWTNPYRSNPRMDLSVGSQVTGDLNPAVIPLPPARVAHTLPDHLMKAREARRAEAAQLAEQAGSEPMEEAEAADPAEADTPTPTPTSDE